MHSFSRRSFLTVAAAGALQAQRRQPLNFIVIYTDDQGVGDMGCYGAADLKTPHMDRLAASGVRFTNWYTNSPVCSPSRASLITGKYPQNAGIPEILQSRPNFQVPGLRQGETTMPGELRKLGYRTACVGKWHLGSAPHSRPMAQGFQEFFGFYSGWTDGYSHRYYTLGNTNPQAIFHDLWRDEQEVWEEPTYHTELFTREAKAFVSRQRTNESFFLYLAYGSPHYPMIAPRKYMDRFPASMDYDRRLHASMLAAVDDGVGEIIDLLKSQGIDRNTVIFFQSDNGATHEVRADHLGRPNQGGSNAPFRGYKGGLFEGGIRMPALMTWPGRIPAGRAVDEMGATMDIAPTFLSWAGKEMSGVDGLNIGRMIIDGAKSPHDAIFWDYAGQTAVRRGEWKLMLNPKTGLGESVVEKVWLSNLKEDPKETRNWSELQPAVTKDLMSRIEAWTKKTG